MEGKVPMCPCIGVYEHCLKNSFPTQLMCIIQIIVSAEWPLIRTKIMIVCSRIRGILFGYSCVQDAHTYCMDGCFQLVHKNFSLSLGCGYSARGWL